MGNQDSFRKTAKRRDREGVVVVISLSGLEINQFRLSAHRRCHRKVKLGRCRLLLLPHSAAQLHNEKQFAFYVLKLNWMRPQCSEAPGVFADYFAFQCFLRPLCFVSVLELIAKWTNGEEKRSAQVHRANVPGGSPRNVHHSLFNLIPNISVIALLFLVGFHSLAACCL